MLPPVGPHDEIALDIEPSGGRAVPFPRVCFHHEVLPARRERLRVTGWFTRRWTPFQGRAARKTQDGARS
jgi:hypothetical protein